MSLKSVSRDKTRNRDPLKMPLKIVYIFCLLSIFLLSSCRDLNPADQKKFMQTRRLMGTNAKVVIYGKSEKDAYQIIEKAFESMQRIEKTMGYWNPKSEVAQINRFAWKKQFQVSVNTYRVINESMKVSRLSDGAFDITVLPLLKMWFRTKKTHRLPTETEIRDNMKKVGYRFLEMDSRQRTIRFNKEGMGLTLDGIATGYVVDSAIEILRKEGVKHALVDVGGEIRVMGGKPGG
jgi:thiamine biosynthesis lipoprotein